MKKTSQDEMVLAYLQSGKTLMPLQALDMFDSLRLGAIIHRLRRDYKIKTEMTKVRSGKWVAKYNLEGEV